MPRYLAAERRMQEFVPRKIEAALSAEALGRDHAIVGASLLAITEEESPASRLLQRSPKGF